MNFYLTPFRRTVLVMLLVGLPWFQLAIFSWIFLINAHLGTEPADLLWMRILILIGAALCVISLKLCFDGYRERQSNFLMVVFALAAIWYLFEWPVKVVMAMLR